ncbi:hypothetical protein SNEBB_007073 [Seison nebaliae]|nr:hypothetical protein SNEBB_007073 [Seison nebaliae]
MEEQVNNFAHFPPFYTLQPNQETRNRQLSLWSERILCDCRTKNKFILSFHSYRNDELFYNSSIDRAVSSQLLEAILHHLEQKDQIKWLNTKHDRCLIMWRSIEDWSHQLISQVNHKGLTNSICTLYELFGPESTLSKDFSNLPHEIVETLLTNLEKKRQLIIMRNDDDNRKIDGVKFL